MCSVFYETASILYVEPTSNYHIGQETKISILFFVCIVTATFVSELQAQEFNDEMKKKLRQSLIVPEQNPLEYKNPQTPQIHPLQNPEVLKVSPTTKLPTKFDRIQILHPPEKYEIHLNLNVTNAGESQLDRATIDYSTGKFNAVPDARSITQWVQYTRGDYGLGVYVGEGSADWVYKVSKFTTPPYSGFDADPVRAIKSHKARKRKVKVDRIKKAYGMD